MNTSDNVIEISKALVAFQAEMEGIAKGADNPFFHSKYADLPSIIAAIKTTMEKHGLAVIQSIENLSDGVISCVSRIMHVSGEWIEGSCPVRCDKMSPQGYGSAIAYARRYGLQAILGLSSVDDDGNGAEKGKKEIVTTPHRPLMELKCADIKRIALKLSADDNKAALAVLLAWSKVTGRDKKEHTIKSWAALNNAQDKWVDVILDKANEAADKFGA